MLPQLGCSFINGPTSGLCSFSEPDTQPRSSYRHEYVLRVVVIYRVICKLAIPVIVLLNIYWMVTMRWLDTKLTEALNLVQERLVQR